MNQPRARPALRYVANLTSVSVQTIVTPMLAFTKLECYDQLLFAFINDDTVNPIDVLIETSEDGVAVDAERVYTLTVPPIAGGVRSQRTLEVQDNIRGWYRVSATATGAPVAARWSLKGAARHT